MYHDRGLRCPCQAWLLRAKLKIHAFHQEWFQTQNPLFCSKTLAWEISLYDKRLSLQNHTHRIILFNLQKGITHIQASHNNIVILLACCLTNLAFHSKIFQLQKVCCMGSSGRTESVQSFRCCKFTRHQSGSAHPSFPFTFTFSIRLQTPIPDHLCSQRTCDFALELGLWHQDLHAAQTVNLHLICKVINPFFWIARRGLIYWSVWPQILWNSSQHNRIFTNPVFILFSWLFKIQICLIIIHSEVLFVGNLDSTQSLLVFSL